MATLQTPRFQGAQRSDSPVISRLFWLTPIPFRHRMLLRQVCECKLQPRFFIVSIFRAGLRRKLIHRLGGCPQVFPQVGDNFVHRFSTGCGYLRFWGVDILGDKGCGYLFGIVDIFLVLWIIDCGAFQGAMGAFVLLVLWGVGVWSVWVVGGGLRAF